MSDVVMSSALDQFTTRREDSLTVKAGTPFEAWARMGLELGMVAKGTPWFIGDWLVQGEQLYGEQYAQAMDVTGLAYHTLMNLATISRRVPPEVRRGADLSHAHHAEVTKFDAPSEQGFWLEQAVAEHLTVRQLRERIRGAHGPAVRADEAKVVRLVETIHAWWDDTAEDADAYMRLMAGTRDDRALLFRSLAERLIRLSR